MNASTKCNNCGKSGHLYYQCKTPITSVGIIAIRRNKDHGQLEYLMIRRKDTLGYIDFMRGKYSIFNRPYIINMLNQMTVEEKSRMRSGDFGLLWQAIWGKPLPPAMTTTIPTPNPSIDLFSSSEENTLINKEGTMMMNQYRSEELTSRDKYNLLYEGVFLQQPERKFWLKNTMQESSHHRESLAFSEKYTLNELIDASDPGWEEPEWGFPKGRRNPQEKDYECAMREFTEETGISAYRHLHNIQNLMPYEEIFTGSNYKSYKHKYYVMFLNPNQYDIALDQYETSEVSQMAWKTIDQARQCIRPYNLEKLRLLDHVDRTLNQFQVMVTKSIMAI